MELFNFFYLFSFLPVIAIGGIFWFERMHRHGAQKRTFYLFASILIIALLGILQTAAWSVRDSIPLFWPQLFVVSVFLYNIAFLLLEYAVHVKRIAESFLTDNYKKNVAESRVWFIVAIVFIAVICLLYGTFNSSHEFFPMDLFLNQDQKVNGALGYDVQVKVWSFFFVLSMIAVYMVSAKKIFNLQEGVIRRRGYPFYLQMVIVLVVTFMQIWQAPTGKAEPNLADLGPMSLFMFINLVFVIRLVEEFFFWSQFNLRSDRNKLEQRQNTQNLLIRRVITSPEEEDKIIVKETMENALEKMKTRLVVSEYNITGLMAYRTVGNLLRIDDPMHILGFCTPLSETRTLKNLERPKIIDLIVRSPFDLREILETPYENLKDFGKKQLKKAVDDKQLVTVSEMPEYLIGLQRLVVTVPIFDSSNVVGFIVAFKDSFDSLYPAEKEILKELTENLGTIFSLMTAKEIQRERNRLQGEMNTAKNIQTSILPKKVKMPGYQVGTYMETATEVGGDVYDFVGSPFGNYFGIGDVSGHGLPAGMMALISMAAFHGAVEGSKSLEKELPLDQIYDVVNRVLCTINRDRIGSDKFMTQNYFVEKNGVVSHVGTHLIAMVYRKDKEKIEEIEGLTDRTGFLGISEYVVSKQSLGSFKMNSGDILFLYSDGVLEAKSGNGSMYNLEGVKNAVINHVDKSPDEIIQALLEDLKRFATTGDFKKHGGHFTDDVSLVVIKKD